MGLKYVLRGYDQFAISSPKKLDNNIVFAVRLSDPIDAGTLRNDVAQKILPLFPLFSGTISNCGNKSCLITQKRVPLEKLVYEINLDARTETANANQEKRTSSNGLEYIANLMGENCDSSFPLWKIVLLNERKNSGNTVEESTVHWMFLIYHHAIGDAVCGLRILSCLASLNTPVTSLRRHPRRWPLRKYIKAPLVLTKVMTMKGDDQSTLFMKPRNDDEGDGKNLSLHYRPCDITLCEFADAAKRLKVSQTALTGALLSVASRRYLAALSSSVRGKIHAYVSFGYSPKREGLIRGNEFRSGRFSLCLEEKSLSDLSMDLHQTLETTTRFEADITFHMIKALSYMPFFIGRNFGRSIPKMTFDTSYIPFFPEKASIQGSYIEHIQPHVNGVATGSCCIVTSYNNKLALSLSNRNGAILDPEAFLDHAAQAVRELSGGL